MAGAIRSASENLPEPYFCMRQRKPGDRAGHADGKPGVARLCRIGIALRVEEHGRRGGRRRGLAIVDGDVAVAVGEMDHHEAAAADIAGARIGDRERKADRHRGIDRVAAAVEDLDADAGGALLLRHHHAVVGEDAARPAGSPARSTPARPARRRK